MPKKNFYLFNLLNFFTCLFFLVRTSLAETGDLVNRIGLLLPLTGDAAYFGEEARRGAEIAVSELAAKARKLELVFQDEKCLAKDAVSAYRALVTEQKVDFVIGPTCTGSIMAVAPLAKAAQRPLLALWDAGRLVESAGEHVFSLGIDTEDEGVLVARHVHSQSLHKIAIVWEEDQYSTLVKESFEEEYRELGGKIIGSESVKPAEHDARAVLTKIIAKKPEAVFLSPAYSAVMLVTQLRGLGYKGKIFGQDTFASPDVIKAGGAVMDEVVFANVQIPDDDSKARFLFDEYKRIHKRVPESLVFAAFGYDSVRIAAGLPVGQNSQVAALRAINYTDGALRFAGFSSSRMSRLAPQLFTIKDGRVGLLN